MSCLATLQEKGFRLTQPRRVILAYIHDRGDHLTAEQIIKHVRQKLPRVNKSTVYRTLDLLEDHGCVFKSEADGGAIYHHAEEGHHHHLVCSRCGQTIDCQEDLFAPVVRLLRAKYDFQPRFQHLVIEGRCAACCQNSR